MESISNVDVPISNNLQTKSRRIETNEIDISSLEHNPRLCPQIDFPMYSLIVYIENEITAKFSIDLIIDDFRDLKTHRLSSR